MKKYKALITTDNDEFFHEFEAVDLEDAILTVSQFSSWVMGSYSQLEEI